jgi:hypothetical protein
MSRVAFGVTKESLTSSERLSRKRINDPNYSNLNVNLITKMDMNNVCVLTPCPTPIVNPVDINALLIWDSLDYVKYLV